MLKKFDNLPDCSPILKADLFSALPAGDREIIAAHSGFLQLRKDSILFSPGEQAKHFFYLVEGCVRVIKNGPDEKEDVVARFAPGDVIGDFDFARSAAYDACAVAEEDSALIMFPSYGCTMEQLTLEIPHTVSKILLSAIQMITVRIKSTRMILMENLSWMQELHRKAYEDPGTGLWKQSFLSDEINRILEEPTALILLKPDRFKDLVDSRGHSAGDEAMVHIALILKNMARWLGRGWPLRFKSNETGLLINKCNSSEALVLAQALHESVAGINPVPAADNAAEFHFTGTVIWGVWPADEKTWDDFLDGSSTLLLESWKAGGDRVVHYTGGTDCSIK
ncbi:MAG: cyclic nucleotide-binding domain-containing protein [Treponema sp.]|nr:cyclic nucleotide-binding domain-containing protein [Treponema sp.]